MNKTLTPPRPPQRRRSQLPDLAAICRTRHIVATLGGRFSLELGIDVDRSANEIERWALAATLFGNRISTAIAMRTYRVLEQAGVGTIQEAGRRDRKELISLLDEGGYVRYDERTAARLLALAEVIAERHDGRLAAIGEVVVDVGQLEQALTALPGWGPVTVQAFRRELRGVWAGAAAPVDTRAARAACHLDLPSGLDALALLATAAHNDFRDVEAGLVRLAQAHDLSGCPGGEECPFAAFDREQLVRF